MAAVRVGVDEALNLVGNSVALANVHVEPAVHRRTSQHVVEQHGRSVVVLVDRRCFSTQHQVALVDFFFDADIKASRLGRVHALGRGTFGGPCSAKLLGEPRKSGN